MQPEDKSNLAIVMEKTMPEHTKRAITIKTVVALSALLTICLALKEYLSTEPQPNTINAQVTSDLPTVSTPLSLNAESNTTLKATGYAKSIQEATVSSKATGRLVELLITEGQKVTKNEVIARIDNQVFLNRVEVTNKNYLLAKAHHEKSIMVYEKLHTQFNRLVPLHEKKMVTKNSFDDKQSDLTIARQNIEISSLELQRAESLQQQAELELDETYIRAPFSGVVVSLNAEVGEIVSPISAGGGYTRTGIATIVDLHRLEVEVEIPEQKLSSVMLGQLVRLDFKALENDQYSGLVKRISPWISQSRTVMIKIALQNPDEVIFPNMSAQASFIKDDQAKISATGSNLTLTGNQ